MSARAPSTGLAAVPGLGRELLDLGRALLPRRPVAGAPAAPAGGSSAPRRARGASRSFDAAAGHRLRAGWGTWTTSADSEIYQSLQALRARSRDHARNNPYMARFVQLVRDNVAGPVGVGFHATPKASDGSVDTGDAERLEAAWARFSAAGTFELSGRLSRADVERLVCDTVATDGEFLARIHYGAPVAGGISLQILDPERLDITVNRRRDPATGIRTSMGVDLDDYGRPVGYWLLKAVPNSGWPIASATPTTARDGEHWHLPAEEVLHVFVPHRAEATRGLPWARASMTALEDLGGYTEAAVVNARWTANKLMWYADSSEAGLPHDDRAEDGTPIIDAELGSYGRLPSGITLEKFDSEYPHAQFGAFVTQALRTVGAGVSVSYHALGNDLSAVNFSSANIGIEEERQVWRALQRGVLIAQFDEPLYRRWLRYSLTTGQLAPLPPSRQAKFRAVRWDPRDWPSINRVRDASADGLEYGYGAQTVSEMIRARGRNPEDVWRERQWETDKMAEYGVTPQAPTTLAPVEDDAPPPSTGSSS